MSEQFSSSHNQSFKLASELVLRPPSSPPSAAAVRHRRSPPPPSNLPASSGFCAPRGAQHNPANRVARFATTRRSTAAPLPGTWSPRAGLRPPESHQTCLKRSVVFPCLRSSLGCSVCVSFCASSSLLR